MAAKELITKTYRIPGELNAWIEDSEKSANQNLIDLLSNYKKVIAVSTNELKGKFTKEEWMYLVDILNGIIINSTFRCNKIALCMEIEEANELDSLCNKYKSVKLDEFITKIKSLSGAQLDALYKRVEEFWSKSEEISLEEWSEF